MSECPGCGHAPHAGRCHATVSPDNKHYWLCPCEHKKEIPDDVHTDRRVGDDDPSVGEAALGAAAGPGAGLGRVGDPPRGSLAESLEELRAVLDEPMVIYGGKTTREMLGGERT